jgi:hypothetical protein
LSPTAVACLLFGSNLVSDRPFLSWILIGIDL